MNETGIEKYHLFYVEAIMHGSYFPQISKIKPIFEDLTLDEFIAMVEEALTSNAYEVVQQFLYYLILFRDIKHIQSYVNSDRFGINMLERLVLFTYGYCSLHDHSTERIIDEILYFVSDERLLELALHSEVISHDKLLLFFIISKFDIEMLKKYFSGVKDVQGLTNYFLNLPEEILRSIISRNHHIFQYIMLMMAEGDAEQMMNADFYNKYKKDIEQFSKLGDIVRRIRSIAGDEKEKDLPFSQRNMNRISYLVNMVRELPDSKKAIEYFDGEHVFIDDFEKKIVYAIVTDPILRDILADYDRMFQIK